MLHERALLGRRNPASRHVADDSLEAELARKLGGRRKIGPEVRPGLSECPPFHCPHARCRSISRVEIHIPSCDPQKLVAALIDNHLLPCPLRNLLHDPLFANCIRRYELKRAGPILCITSGEHFHVVPELLEHRLPPGNRCMSGMTVRRVQVNRLTPFDHQILQRRVIDVVLEGGIVPEVAGVKDTPSGAKLEQRQARTRTMVRIHQRHFHQWMDIDRRIHRHEHERFERDADDPMR